MSAGIEGILSSALSSSPLSNHLDEDTSEYILSILLDDPNDADAREAVQAFVASSLDDTDIAGSSDVCDAFFEILDNALGNDNHHTDTNSNAPMPSNDDLPRRLDAAVTLKEHDIQTFASGLVANVDPSDINDSPSEIQTFYANMIDVSKHPRAKSERERRKARQREMRESMEEEERKRAIDDAMRMMADETDANEAKEEEMIGAADNAADVHFTVSYFYFFASLCTSCSMLLLLTCNIDLFIRTSIWQTEREVGLIYWLTLR